MDVAFIAAVIAMGIFLNWKIMEIITFAFFYLDYSASNSQQLSGSSGYFFSGFDANFSC